MVKNTNTLLLVMLKDDSFVRTFGEIGYISNQTTKKDRVYDRVGVEFLNTIARNPTDVDNICDTLAGVFACDKSFIFPDVIMFLQDLEQEGFILLAGTEKELRQKNARFTYRTESPKTFRSHAEANKGDFSHFPSTTSFLKNYFKSKPTIFGIHIELTANCNEQCLHCYLPHGRSGHFDKDLLKKVFVQLRNFGTLSLTLSGGEPLLHPNFEELLLLARDYDFIVNILTNGTLVKERHAQLFWRANVNMVQVSLYSMDPNIHDAITQTPGSHKKTIAGIEQMLSHDVPVQISCPITRLNKMSYKEVTKWCHERKIRVLSDFILMARSNFDTRNLALRLSLADMDKVINDIIEVDASYQEILKLDPTCCDEYRGADQPVCGVGIDNACIAWDGAVYPCAGFQGLTLGNVREHSIAEIWQTSDTAKQLRGITNNSFPKCMACDTRDFCTMCLVRNFNENNGDLFAINPFYCDVARINKDAVECALASPDINIPISPCGNV